MATKTKSKKQKKAKRGKARDEMPELADLPSPRAWREIRAMQDEADTFKTEWKSLKADAKAARERYEAKRDDIADRIRDFKNPKHQTPLFDRLNGQNGHAPTGQAGDAEAWRDTPIERVLKNCTARQITLLQNADLTTLGQVEDFRAAKDGRPWGIKGVGPELVTKIEEAIITWLTEWRSHQTAPAEASPAAGPGLQIAEGTAAAADVATPDPMDAHKDVKLSVVFEDAGVSEAITAAFAADGLTTVGDLQLRLQNGPGEALTRTQRLCAIPGIDEQKARKVEKALAKFAKRMHREAIANV